LNLLVLNLPVLKYPKTTNNWRKSVASQFS